MTHRERYFAELPAKDDAEFGRFWRRITRPQAHGFYKEKSNLPYETFDFMRANARRKYGADWYAVTAKRAHERLHAWGLNTIANWSDAGVYRLRQTPYTLSLGTDDAAAWARFFDLYSGFVFAIARSKGLPSEDADDIVQGVLSELARKMPISEYDRTKGRSRSCLLGLINWRVLDKLKADKRESELIAVYCEEKKSAHDDKVESVPVAEAAFIDREWQNAAFNEELRRLQEEVRPDHFAAFVESTVEGIDTETVTTALNPREFYLAQQLVGGYSYKEIASKLNISSGQVNNVVAAIYRKLGVHRKADLAKLV